MYLFFDTETSGLPRSFDAPPTDVDNWPRLVEIAWVACDAEGQELVQRQSLIKPQGFEISPAAFGVHGITTERAAKDGVELLPVLTEFVQALRDANVLVAHNMAFDENVLRAELVRAGLPNAFAGKRRVCTMKESAAYCGIRGSRGFKWPGLTELYRRLFRKPFAGAHGALADALACKACYFRLRELKVLS